MILPRFPVLIRCCWFGLNRLLRERIAALPVTTVQYTVLRTIHDCRPKKLNQRELAALISTNKNNLSSIVKRLEALKYIKLEGNPEDKRENKINITSIGNEIFKKSEKIALELQEKVTNDLTTREENLLSKYLTRVNEQIPTTLDGTVENNKA
jgi:DNA-binding MarR family transcriptional regulator